MPQPLSQFLVTISGELDDFPPYNLANKRLPSIENTLMKSWLSCVFTISSEVLIGIFILSEQHHPGQLPQWASTKPSSDMGNTTVHTCSIFNTRCTTCFKVCTRQSPILNQSTSHPEEKRSPCEIFLLTP